MQHVANEKQKILPMAKVLNMVKMVFELQVLQVMSAKMVEFLWQIMVLLLDSHQSMKMT